jgi:hypothetical protein
MTKEIHGYFNDDGTEFNPNLVPVPALCASCRKNDDPAQEIPCALARNDRNENRFICLAYESIRGHEETRAVLKEIETFLDRRHGKAQ